MQERLAKLLLNSWNTEKEKKSMLAELKLSKQQKLVFDALKELMYLKEYRNGIRSYANYCSEKILHELCMRAGISLQQSRYLWPEEISKALKAGKADSDLLNQRMKYCVFIYKNGKGRILEGKKARKVVEREIKPEAVDTLKELTGVCACPGNVTGIARIAGDASECHGIGKNDVIVTAMTTPDFVPAMKRAAAVVTDEGGITCHAAIVSREFGIPCVIGTRFATKAIKEGELIRVDATHGLVKIISQEGERK